MAIPMITVTNASTLLERRAGRGRSSRVAEGRLLMTFAHTGTWIARLHSLRAINNSRVVGGRFVVLDNLDQAGVLVNHEMSNQGAPLGKVFAKLDISNGTSWTVTLSHELLEMLADPWTNWCAGSDNKIYALEVADPVEADELGYEIDGVRVSDFITPAWFDPTEAYRLDFTQRLSKQLEIAPGGYISVLDPRKGWTQVTAKGEGGPKVVLGSRRGRRKLGRRSRKASAAGMS